MAAIDSQQFDLPLQQQYLPPWQLAQWQRQIVVPELHAVLDAICIDWQWQPGSKCPLGLMQPETTRPFRIASGAIVQITTARKQ